MNLYVVTSLNTSQQFQILQNNVISTCMTENSLNIISRSRNGNRKEQYSEGIEVALMNDLVPFILIILTESE